MKMAGSTTDDWWQQSRFSHVIARNSRITEVAGAELAAVRVFLKFFWDVTIQSGTRPWLETMFRNKSQINYRNGQTLEAGEVDSEPPSALAEMLSAVGRDLKKIPLTTAEGDEVDTLIAATGNRKTGETPFFGSTI